ncbi:IclR family transcriptional regulator [Rhizobium sp. SSA_523]|uniref:IclR family transcriptional regulator n=1 Tax=Rhizobium sp. SSA_523 TaxID=2952477 RepID=UPI002091405F|nr:IclR family transcriptional regulator [Rhizobium sp. SSA_523]MCO5731602.1 IclR family transcriptional regulator [Rhizobium sp. SSA_523]WKC21885.1 IclR family transcriptional regulator [Rhizobium sp. SSA_523]
MDEETDLVDANSDDRPYKVNVLDRAIAILDAFAQGGPSLSLSEIALRTNLHVSTCLRLITNLRHHGLIAKDEASGRYRLGYRLLTLAEIARGNSGLVEAALPTMRDLSRQFNETVVLSVRVGDSRVDIEQVIGQQSVRRVVTLGTEKPLYAGAASRALLAGMSDEELNGYLQRTELKKLASQTITDERELRAAVTAVRETGYAESVQEQYDNSGGGVVSMIRGVRSEVIGVIGISVPQFRFSEELKKQLRPAVVAAARRISDSIGGRY